MCPIVFYRLSTWRQVQAEKNRIRVRTPVLVSSCQRLACVADYMYRARFSYSRKPIRLFWDNRRRIEAQTVCPYVLGFRGGNKISILPAPFLFCRSCHEFVALFPVGVRNTAEATKNKTKLATGMFALDIVY